MKTIFAGPKRGNVEEDWKHLHEDKASFCTNYRMLMGRLEQGKRVIEGDGKGPSGWGYNWATISLGDIHSEILFSRLGLNARLKILLRENIIVAKSKELKIGWNLAEC
jgi:hypothetical protein